MVLYASVYDIEEHNVTVVMSMKELSLRSHWMKLRLKNVKRITVSN